MTGCYPMIFPQTILFSAFPVALTCCAGLSRRNHMKAEAFLFVFGLFALSAVK
jgi:hypothetical protein